MVLDLPSKSSLPEFYARSAGSARNNVEKCWPDPGFHTRLGPILREFKTNSLELGLTGAIYKKKREACDQLLTIYI